MNTFAMKKWYFDFIGNGGESGAYLYLIALRIMGYQFGNVALHRWSKGTPDLRISKNLRIGREAWNDQPSVGESRLRWNEGKARLHLEVEGVLLDILYHPGCPAWVPSEDGRVLRQGSQGINWRVPVPRAVVRGSLVMDGRSIELDGTGYHDIVEIDVPPWRLPLNRLLWGRAHCSGETVVYNRLEHVDGSVSQNLLLQDAGRGLVESKRFRIGTTGDGEETVIESDTVKLRLHRKGILEHKTVVTEERIPWGLARRLLGRFSRTPMELKMVSGADLCTGGNVFSGFAIHEDVQWDREAAH